MSMTIGKRLTSYVQLTKPTIMLLVLFTGATALVVEGSLLRHPMQFALVLLGLYLTGGSANAFNQYFERDIDARMSRTARRRPLPLHMVSAKEAFWFAVTIGAAGVALFAVAFNWLTALLSLATLLFYALFYTLWLKPHTWQNIVIGGAAGAMAPVGAWTAASGSMAVAPWLMFALVFLWTPPHFWALAMICKDDYVKAGLPMLPVVKGEGETIRQILWYSGALIAVSLTLFFAGAHWLYFAAAVGLGIWLIKKALVAREVRTMTAYRSLFGYSIIYLFALFAAIIVDNLLLA
ncbi:protoheme IX farnesyltransferase [candidate division GN15 bacterium]|uniref:Protoheme IX farnesyltransferase n=1 Tax=candidate division GN15 bacterium TaxID=2072418 RepID=A0A855X1F7_9BACT|nr:MAG: protoheme IX farnesyltransferase [candidate division GN15 bacterium]